MKIDWTKVKEGFTTMDVLKEENKELKEEIERLNGALQTHEILLKSNVLEIERLNNIINELEKYAQDLLENGTWSKCGAHKILDKLQELKGVDKE